MTTPGLYSLSVTVVVIGLVENRFNVDHLAVRLIIPSDSLVNGNCCS